MSSVVNPFAAVSTVGQVRSFRDVPPPSPARREPHGRHVRRVFKMDELTRVFPDGVLNATKSSDYYRLFVPNRVEPDEAIFWGSFFSGSALDHASRVRPFSLGWGMRSAGGWEPIG